MLVVLNPRLSGVRFTVQVPVDDRSAVAKAMSWASRIIGLSLEMVVPGIGGYWLDQKLGTEPWLLLAGFALGMVLATLQLIAMVAQANRQRDAKHAQDSVPPQVRK